MASIGLLHEPAKTYITDWINQAPWPPHWHLKPPRWFYISIKNQFCFEALMTEPETFQAEIRLSSGFLGMGKQSVTLAIGSVILTLDPSFGLSSKKHPAHGKLEQVWQKKCT